MSKRNNRSKEFSVKHRYILVCLFLVMATLAVYWQVQNFDFVNYDDSKYIYENRHVQRGLTTENFIWAFTDGTRISNYWHPLTWISHILDIQFYGMNAGGHHLTNLLLHIANTLILFSIFKNMTGHLGRSAFVAALFALHPLHVESVAWVAERKDVLSTFFWLLTMGAYSRYAARPKIDRYVVVLLFFVMGLMAKPMLVTLPFVLLLMDFWPLDRLQWGQEIEAGHIKAPKFSALYLVVEKVPFFAITVVASIAAYITQRKGGAVPAMDFALLKMQTANAIVAYISYIGKMIWPVKLAAYYPHPGMLPVWQVVGAGLFIACVSVFGVWRWRQFPYFAFGWFWFLGTFVPVIGFVKIGDFFMADRYTYVPFIGLFVIMAWGVPELVAQWRYRKIWLATLATVLLTILMAVTWKQVGYWKNSITLFKHTLKITSNNFIAHKYIGTTLSKQGRTKEAIEHYLQALRIKPDFVDAHNDLGNALDKQGRTEEAIEHYLQALQIKPDFEKAHSNLGNALDKQGRTEEAIEHYLQALQIKPDFEKAHYNLGNALSKQGRTEEAIEHYLQALRIKPDFEKAHNNLAVVLFRKGNIEEAIAHFRKVLQINPDHMHAKNNLKKVLMIQQQKQ
ncbi:tetratricopeptide repeat protein [Thermodesulfobacteriota bacterium]